MRLTTVKDSLTNGLISPVLLDGSSSQLVIVTLERRLSLHTKGIVHSLAALKVSSLRCHRVEQQDSFFVQLWISNDFPELELIL
jgi:hypothetical protein